MAGAWSGWAVTARRAAAESPTVYEAKVAAWRPDSGLMVQVCGDADMLNVGL